MLEILEPRVVSVFWGAIFFAMAAVIAFVIVRPLHRLFFPTHRRPSHKEVIEAVGSNILITYPPAIILAAILCAVFGKPLSQFAHLIAPQIAASLGPFGLFFVLVAFTWTAIISGLGLYFLKEITHPDYDPVKQWAAGMRRVIEGMKNERAKRKGE